MDNPLHTNTTSVAAPAALGQLLSAWLLDKNWKNLGFFCKKAQPRRTDAVRR
jgi:hypothetical protein